MPDYDFTLYDTAVFGATANTLHELFQVAQGADATHTKSFTNSRGAGSLPVTEQFVVTRVKVLYDHNTVTADVPKFHPGSYLEFILNNQTILIAPLAEFIANSGYGGHYSQAAAADEAVIGLLGDGYVLTKPIVIKGGTAFKVQLFQSLAVTAASNMKAALDGILTMAAQ
jgi:hypothetical protein